MSVKDTCFTRHQDSGATRRHSAYRGWHMAQQRVSRVCLWQAQLRTAGAVELRARAPPPPGNQQVYFTATCHSHARQPRTRGLVASRALSLLASFRGFLSGLPPLHPVTRFASCSTVQHWQLHCTSTVYANIGKLTSQIASPDGFPSCLWLPIGCALLFARRNALRRNPFLW